MNITDDLPAVLCSHFITSYSKEKVKEKRRVGREKQVAELTSSARLGWNKVFKSIQYSTELKCQYSTAVEPSAHLHYIMEVKSHLKTLNFFFLAAMFFKAHILIYMLGKCTTALWGHICTPQAPLQGDAMQTFLPVDISNKHCTVFEAARFQGFQH